MPFPQNLRRLRLARFLSQAELARQSDLHTVTISRLEAGRVKPSTRTVRALANPLAVTPGGTRDTRGSRRGRQRRDSPVVRLAAGLVGICVPTSRATSRHPPRE